MTVCRLLQSPPPPEPFAAVVASLEQFSSRCPYPYPTLPRPHSIHMQYPVGATKTEDTAPQGHAADGGGVQKHSCGALYPYVLGYYGPAAAVFTPDGRIYPCLSIRSAQRIAEAFLANPYNLDVFQYVTPKVPA